MEKRSKEQSLISVEPIAGSIVSLSKNCEFIVASSGSKVTIFKQTIRDNGGVVFDRIASFQCLDKIDFAEISNDNTLVMCAMFNRNCVQVFSLTDPEWKCRINEGPAGMISAFFAPDSASVFIESDFGIQMSLYNLVNQSQCIIHLPKPLTKVHHTILSSRSESPSHVCSVSERHSLVAILNRIELQDYVSVFAFTGNAAAPLQEVNKFRCKGNQDACGVYWLEGFLVVVDSLLYYKCCVYSPTGEVLLNYEAYQNALGIRCLAFPTEAAESKANVFAIGSFDSKVRLVSLFNWSMFGALSLAHPRELPVGSVADDFVMKVDLAGIAANDASSTAGKMFGHFVSRNLKALPRSAEDKAVKTHKTPEGVSLPQMGITLLRFSPSRDLLAAVDEVTPRCLFLFCPLKLSLIDLVVCAEGVVDLSWRPRINSSETVFSAANSEAVREDNGDEVLCWVCNSSHLYLWHRAGGVQKIDTSDTANAQNNSAMVNAASTAMLTHKFKLQTVQWLSDGLRVLVKGREHFVVIDLSSALAQFVPTKTSSTESSSQATAV